MELLHTGEVAELVGEDKRTIERKARAGKYPKGICGKHGRFWLFNKEKLLEAIFNGELSQV